MESFTKLVEKVDIFIRDYENLFWFNKNPDKPKQNLGSLFQIRLDILLILV